MAELTLDIVAEVVETCKQGSAEAAEALGRALDAPGLQVSVGESGSLAIKSLPEGFDGPGLVVLMTIGKWAALLALPESSGMVPAWCAEPDPTGESKLSTLAQELGMILLPEQFMPDEFQAARVRSLAGALGRGGAEDGAALVPLELAQESKKGEAYLVWPLVKPTAVIGKLTAKPSQEKKAASEKPDTEKKASTAPTPPGLKPASKPRIADLEHLPPYTRSLLRVKVPVVVTLAQKRQPLGRIVELGPGSIIQFDKSCEEMLDLDVGDHRVAQGEAVKVGEKFGLRITSMILPDERFLPLRAKVPEDG